MPTTCCSTSTEPAKCPITQLTPPDDIDDYFNQPTSSCVTFKLGKSGKCFADQRIKVCLTFIFSTSWKPCSTKKELNTDKCGQFKVHIPANVTDIRVKVTIFEQTCYSLVYTGAPCGATPLSYLEGEELNRFAMMRYANILANDTSGFDHTLSPPDQMGPVKAARALGMALVAGFDAYNSIVQVYNDYLNLTPVSSGASVEAAIIQAVITVLLPLFPQQSAALQSKLATALSLIPNGTSKTNGIAAGNAAANKMLLQRSTDGAPPPATPEQMLGTGPGQYPEGTALGQWSRDPISNIPFALGSNWGSPIIGGQPGGGGVVPFVIASSSAFRVPPFPAFDSPEYALAFNEVKSLGGSGSYPLTVRSEDDTIAGMYWAYDGTPSLCAPPRLYNQIATLIATQEKTSPVGYGRLVAQLNLTLADCGIAAWESKYFYKIWRPVTAIPFSPNGNTAAVPDPTWIPYGAPRSNTSLVNFTPPFPSFPSGHSVFGGGLFQLLRTRYGDDVHFTFVSDEYNGITKNSDGTTRPLLPRSFTSFSQAEEENGQSRIFLGIHFNRDKVDGIGMGNAIADHIIERTYVKL